MILLFHQIEYWIALELNCNVLVISQSNEDSEDGHAVMTFIPLLSLKHNIDVLSDSLLTIDIFFHQYWYVATVELLNGAIFVHELLL